MDGVSAHSTSQIKAPPFFSFKTQTPISLPITLLKRHAFRKNLRDCNSSKLQNCIHVAEFDFVRGPSLSAHKLFDEIPIRDTFAWNNLIHTQLTNGNCSQAQLSYLQMLLRCVRPDRHTLPRVLAASRLSKDLNFGKQVHGQALKLGLSSDRYVVTALMELYGHLEGADAAQWVFDKSAGITHKSTIAWTMLAKLFVTEKKPLLAISLFKRMVESRTAKVDSVTFATAIGACGVLRLLQEGRNIHQVATEYGLASDVLVSNSLMKMYLDCGTLEDARVVFDSMPLKDAISWTEMLRGYVKNGGFNEGLKLFRLMNVAEGIKPDPLAVSSILPACARVAAHKQGKEIHGYLLRHGINLNLTLQNALMDMYAKSGFIEYASMIFTSMMKRDAISWTVMILGNTLHGHGKLAVDKFRKMEKHSKQEIDQGLYVALLYACSVANLVEYGKFYFSRIKSPQVEHYALMVATLARSGYLNEAWTYIEEQNLSHHAEVLRALLDGCRIHKNALLGKRVLDQLCDMEPLNAENYVLLSNWYAHNAKWDMVDDLKETITDMGLKTKEAYSWIELKNKVHVFGTRDLSHPKSVKIYSELESLVKKLDQEGFQLTSDFFLHDVNGERECNPFNHSEMLAISFGLISTQEGAKIRLTKNLRICRDCHNATSLISKIVEREIIIKDKVCFHHFKDGVCSCGDF